MKPYDQLVQSLNQLVTVYRHLLEAVRREHDALVSARMDDLADINFTKEKLVLKVKSLDEDWQKAADALSAELKINKDKPSLMELAVHCHGEESTKLEQLHSVLNMLVSRIVEINKNNEPLVHAALSHIAGAMGSITQTLNENPTYKNSGNLGSENKDAQGRLVRREV
jgi:hypothetical protein